MTLYVNCADIPDIPRKEAKPKLTQLKDYLSQEFTLNIVDNSAGVKPTVELLDERKHNVNSVISQFLAKDSNAAPGVWNKSLFSEADLNPRHHACYIPLPASAKVRAVVLHQKSSSLFFLCTEESSSELKNFQVEYIFLVFAKFAFEF